MIHAGVRSSANPQLSPPCHSQRARRPARGTTAQSRNLLLAFLPPLPVPWGLYRRQSNDPVRRGVLQFLSCARQGPPWRRYRSRHAGRLKSRSLLLKEPEHGHPAHAHPARGCLLNPRPLDAQFVERLLILRRELVVLDLPAVLLQVANFQVGQLPRHGHFALDLRRLAQQLRHQQPALAVHFHLLTPVVRSVEKLLLRRIESGEPCQLLLDPLPFLEGIQLCNLPVEARDIELLTVLLVEHALEFRGDLEPSFFVHASWVIAAKHVWLPRRQKR